MHEKISKISKKDSLYPKLLREITDHPESLYIRGNISANDLCLAVVGTRKFSFYGKQVTENLVSKLASRGITIVSGLAFGIDAIAHKAALDASGRTIAVLGTGIDDKSVYPQSNLSLAKRILESKGALISEYPPGTEGYKSNFPRRNRIISGMCVGTLVTEAPKKSGALITAFCALDQNREVFAVPGNITSPNSFGTNRLIQLGATPVIDVVNIFNALGIEVKNNTIKGAANSYQPHNEEEKRVLQTLSQGMQTADEIIRLCKMNAAEVNGTLSILEIKGVVKNIGGNQYIVSYES